MPEPGARLTAGGARFAVRAPRAESVTLCLFDGREERRFPMVRQDDLWVAEAQGVGAGQRYAFRAQGAWAPERGLWFDPAKRLVDPYATAIDRPFAWHPALNEYGVDTAVLVPWSVLEAPLQDMTPAPPVSRPAASSMKSTCAASPCCTRTCRRRSAARLPGSRIPRSSRI